jgi:hypothetical protein
VLRAFGVAPKLGFAIGNHVAGVVELVDALDSKAIETHPKLK